MGFLAALFFLVGLTPGQLADAMKSADGLLLALALLMLSILLLMLSLKWYIIARWLGIAVPFVSTTKLYLTAMVLNNVLPTAIGGDFYRVYFLSREGDTSLKRSLASVIVERASGYAGLLVLSAPAAAFYFLGAMPGIGASLATLGLFGLAYIALKRLRTGPDPGGENQPPVWLSLRSARSDLYAVAALSVVQQALWVSAAAVFARAYGVSVPWSYWALVVTAVTLVTVLPVSVGGLGLREASYAALLAPLGVEASKAAAIGLAMGFGPSLLSLVALLPFVALGLRPPSPSLLRGEVAATPAEPTATRAQR
jgi:uncharacterized membrane protein YbhN (UPF0104 family)